MAWGLHRVMLKNKKHECMRRADTGIGAGGGHSSDCQACTCVVCMTGAEANIVELGCDTLLSDCTMSL